MAVDHAKLLETHIVGEDTRQWIVRSESCLALRRRDIAHVGVGDAATPYRIVRTKLSGAYLHATLGGEGRMLIDGRWRAHRVGTTSMAPAHVLHAFHAIPSRRWQYCWVRYMPSSPRSLVHAMAPVMARFDPEPLRHAIMGLVHETGTQSDEGASELWVDLIERYVDRFSEPWRREERLLTLWSEVRQELARNWTLDQLAGIARTSSEHLRRLCRRSLGRSPMQQLTVLRMQHAAHLLATTEVKIEAVAHEVGYQNSFAFSNTFKRMTGLRPSEFRSRKRGRRPG
jgi:AraC-like DNA-binding protein